MFYKRNKKTINPRLQEVVVLIFFTVSFLLYGVISLQFYRTPETDPLRFNGDAASPASLVLIGVFWVYGVYAVVMRRSRAGKILGAAIVIETMVAASWKIVFTDASVQTVRLSGSIEGFTCCAICIGLLIAVWRGASIWD